MSHERIRNSIRESVQRFRESGDVVAVRRALEAWMSRDLKLNVDETLDLCERLVGLGYIVKFPAQARSSDITPYALKESLSKLLKVFESTSSVNSIGCASRIEGLLADIEEPDSSGSQIQLYEFIRHSLGNSAAAYDYAMNAYQLNPVWEVTACCAAAVSLDLGLVDECEFYLQVAVGNAGGETVYIKNVRLKLLAATSETGVGNLPMVSIPIRKSSAEKSHFLRKGVDSITTRGGLHKRLVEVSLELESHGPNSGLLAEQSRIVQRLRDWNHQGQARFRVSQVPEDLLHGVSPYMHRFQSLGIVYTLDDVNFYAGAFRNIAQKNPRKWHFVPNLCVDDLRWSEVENSPTYVHDFDFVYEPSDEVYEVEDEEMFVFDEREGEWTAWDQVN